MKDKILITLLSALALAGSCTRVQHDRVLEKINYAFSAPSTKVMSADEFKAAGNEMTVYDVFYTGDKRINYIDGVSVVSPGDDGIWSYKDQEEKKYYWLEGTHSLWGYSSYYKSIDKSFLDIFAGSSFDIDKKKLSIEKTKVNWNLNQFDFAYSTPETRVISSNSSDITPVALECRHLFSAIGIAAVNKLPHSSVTVKRVYIKNLINKNSATVLFDRSEEQASFGTGSKDGHYADISLSSFVLQPASSEGNECKNIFDTGSSSNGFYLVWPQTIPAVHPTEDPESGEISYDSDDTLICVEYSINDGETLTREVPFPNIKNSLGVETTMALEAGKKHLITINFVNKMLELNCQVLPWEYEESVLDYTDATAQADPIYTDPVTAKATYLFYDTDRLSDDGSGNLIIDPRKGKANVNDEAKTVTMVRGLPVTARFRLNSPQGAEWMVDLVGPDRREFNVVKETSNLIDGTNCNFRIEPKNTSPTKELRVNVRITLRLADGRTASVDEILQGGKNLSNQYTIIQPIAH